MIRNYILIFNKYILYKILKKNNYLYILVIQQKKIETFNA